MTTTAHYVKPVITEAVEGVAGVGTENTTGVSASNGGSL
jgi:hypothetical protein